MTMFRDPDSLYLDDLEEFYRDDRTVYFACRKVNGNTELVCDGLEIEDGGNSPDDECLQIVESACRAFEDVLGFGTTKVITFFHHARPINGETTLAMADIERDDDGDIVDDDDRRWIERSDLPAEAEELLAKADEAFDTAYDKAVADVESQHRESANQWIEQLIADEDWDSLRDSVEDSLANESVLAKAKSLLEKNASDED